MKIGGLQKLSLIDFPHKLSIVIFTIGCNFRCPFCHNPNLVLPEKYPPPIPEKEIFEFLESRKRYVKGVVITGGEPTIHADLPEFLKRIKEIGYELKLDTNGTNPEMLAELIRKKLVDYVAMDVKAPFEKYNKATGVNAPIEKIKKSISILLQNKVDYELRTTVAPFLTFEDIKKIAKEIKGTKHYYLQQFEGAHRKLVKEEFENAKPVPKQKLEEWCQRLKKEGYVCEVR